VLEMVKLSVNFHGISVTCQRPFQKLGDINSTKCGLAFEHVRLRFLQPACQFPLRDAGALPDLSKEGWNPSVNGSMLTLRHRGSIK